MNCSPKPKLAHADRVAEPFAGKLVPPAELPARDDLSDWLELMEAVEALCPVWPRSESWQEGGSYLL